MRQVDELAKTIGLRFKQDAVRRVLPLVKSTWIPESQDGNEGQPFTLTVLEEGELATLLLQRGKQSGLLGIKSLLFLPRPIQRVPCAPGSNLRKTLLANGFQEGPHWVFQHIVLVFGGCRDCQVYQDLRSVFNCNAQQLCGTCVSGRDGGLPAMMDLLWICGH